MRWSPMVLQRQDPQAGADRLGNPAKQLQKLAGTRGRVSGWTAAELAMESRTVTQTSRKIVTPAALDVCRKADACLLEGVCYEITEVRDYGKWRLLVARAWRTKEGAG